MSELSERDVFDIAASVMGANSVPDPQTLAGMKIYRFAQAILSARNATLSAAPVPQEDALPALPDPAYIYHPESGTEGADDWVSDDLFEFALSGAVDEGCTSCIRLYTKEALQDYARAALAARPVVDNESKTMSDKSASESPVIHNALPALSDERIIEIFQKWWAAPGVTHADLMRTVEAEVRAAARDDARDALTAAAVDVLAERRRQIESEGWTPGHDDNHESGDLAHAAACYAAGNQLLQWFSGGTVWPFGWEFKPADPRRKLVKAGALILAEIERLDRIDAARGEK